MFLLRSIFPVPKIISLNSTHYFIMKIRNKGELQKIENNLSCDTGFQEFMNLYEKCTTKPYSLLVINTTLA